MRRGPEEQLAEQPCFMGSRLALKALHKIPKHQRRPPHPCCPPSSASFAVWPAGRAVPTPGSRHRAGEGTWDTHDRQKCHFCPPLTCRGDGPARPAPWPTQSRGLGTFLSRPVVADTPPKCRIDPTPCSSCPVGHEATPQLCQAPPGPVHQDKQAAAGRVREHGRGRQSHRARAGGSPQGSWQSPPHPQVV